MGLEFSPEKERGKNPVWSGAYTSHRIAAMDSFGTLLSNIVVVVALSCFVKILTTMSIFRYGLGLRGAGFGVVIIIFSLGVSWFIMEPAIEKVGGLEAVTGGSVASPEVVEGAFRPFLESHTDADVLSKMKEHRALLHSDELHSDELHSDELHAEDKHGETSLAVLVPAFLISELKEAFFLGFLFIIPFFVIDLLVANAILLLGMTNLETFVVSFPLKLLLFFSVDGWSLVTERLLQSYLP